MICLQNLSFQYPRSDFRLDLPRLEINASEKIAIVGPSGSGKTTLLNLIPGIVIPDSGSVSVNENVISSMSDAQRRNFRIANIGMVFQQFELIEYLDVRSNILLPFDINDSLKLTSETKEEADQLAAAMGMGDKLKRTSTKLSQGEQQRVAICRALITNPKIILADEPTGNLDPKNKQVILDLLFQQANENRQTLVVVTHDVGILDGFDRVIDFEQFRVETELPEASK